MHIHIRLALLLATMMVIAPLQLHGSSAGAQACQALIFFDVPGAGGSASGSGTTMLAGWALDTSSTSGSGVTAVHVYRDGPAGGSGVGVGVANIGIDRPDVDAVYSRSNARAGWQMMDANFTGVSAGKHTLHIYANTVCGWVASTFDVDVRAGSSVMSVDVPSTSASTTTTTTTTLPRCPTGYTGSSAACVSVGSTGANCTAGYTSTATYGCVQGGTASCQPGFVTTAAYGCQPVGYGGIFGTGLYGGGLYGFGGGGLYGGVGYGGVGYGGVGYLGGGSLCPAGYTTGTGTNQVGIYDGPPGYFSPNPITVRVGQTVTWMNCGPINSHTSTSLTNVWDTGTIAVGQTRAFTFTTAGTFPYRCSIHGHTGTVIVTT
ncbi:MAG: Cupredoxin-like protein [Chloroflexi bacterium]|nr:Cupredoxin-like protein [Chloroflexota bacterium]